MSTHQFQTEEGRTDSFEVFHDPTHPFGSSWYWQYGITTYGPFPTEKEAFFDAQDFTEGGN